MEEKNENEQNQNQENGQTSKNEITESENNTTTQSQSSQQQNQNEEKNNEESNIIKNEKEEEIPLLKDKDLIKTIKSNNYQDYICSGNFVDYRTREDKSWKVGLITEIKENSYIIKDTKDENKYEIKKSDTKKISYFRKYSSPESDVNFYKRRDKEKDLMQKLNFLEKVTRGEKNIFSLDKTWDIYYILHSKIFFGLDAAMKVNTKSYSNYGYYNEDDDDDDNEGIEISFKMILCIVVFLKNYYKYILENIEEFIFYQKNIINTELEDLKIINKKCAFFSFFDESYDLLSKIFGNKRYCLYWYSTFEDELNSIIPYFVEDEEKNGGAKKDKMNAYPIYGEEKEEEKNLEKNENEVKLKKICLKNAYNYATTFTSDKVKVKAIYIAYFIDYFNAINGFSYIAQLLYSSKNIDIQLFNSILQIFSFSKILTHSYNKTITEERKKVYEYLDDLIESLDEKSIVENKKKEILNLAKTLTNMFFKDEPKIIEKLNFHYISKNLFLSKKLEQKINSLSALNEILKNIKTEESELTLQDFCEICRKYKILNILNDKNVHEEIIKRLPDIIYIMYENNFGYEKNEENLDKINQDKILIFDVLFEKMLESEQNNEKLVKNIQSIICDFCRILNDEDKLKVYNDVINYINKSIEKKGIPMKEHLSFIIDYSVKALENKNNNKEKNNDKDNKVNKEEEINNGEIKNGGEENNNDENDINSKIENNEFYGMNLLMQYLTEENYNKYNMTNEQKIDIINQSIAGLIKLINSCEASEQIAIFKNICSKTNSAIINTNNEVQYLIFLDKLKSEKEFGKRFSDILNDYSLKEHFFSLLMSDVDRYISLITKNSDEKIKEKDNIKVYEGLFSNELNIKLRLNLIFFLLQNQQNITRENLEDFNNKIINSCEKDKYASDVLNNLLYSNLKNFSSDVIQFLYNNLSNSEIKEEKFNDYQYYIFCTAIITEINKIEKRFYLMNGKDLAITNCETEQNIKGIDLLWSFLIRTKNDKIRNKVNDFLADIFFGVRLGTKKKLQEFWTDFVSNIYSKLEEIIQKENNINDNENENAANLKAKYNLSIQGIISLIKKIENKFMNQGEIVKDINQITKEVEYYREINIKDDKEEKYTKIFFSGNLNKTGKVLDYDLKIGSSELFYMFRYKLSQFYKIPVNLIYVIIDDIKYNNKLKSSEEFKRLKFDMYNDLDNSYNAFTELGKKINSVLNNNIENPLILKVEVKKENEHFKFIKRIIKDYPKLMHLLKRKHSECLLDVWCLIKEDELKINNDIINMIKDILYNKNEDNLDNIFNFNETNIYYISFILFHLNSVINEYTKSNEQFISEVFLQSKIWNKLMDIKIETSCKPHLGEIYEKNNIINYLLNIYKIISLKTNDENILLFILNKTFEFYYQTINDCININLKWIPSTEGFQVDFVEDLYISNTNVIKDIIIKNQFIYKKFLELLLNKDSTGKENKIKNIFEFLFFEGLLKNRLYPLNLKLQSFLMTIIDDKFFSLQDKQIINDFYVYILNYFFSQEKYDKLLNCIKDIALNGSLDSCLNVDKYEKNIELYYDIINDIVDKIYPVISTFYSFGQYIKKIILPSIYNPIIRDVPVDASYHEIILGGNLKLLLNLLSRGDYKDILKLKNEDEEKLKQYLFNEIILNKCNKKIFTKENINNYHSILISSSYTFKHAINIFIFLVIQNIQNEKEEKINYYFETITEFHKECYWKGSSILDWKLEYKDNTRLSPFVGLKNLGCTCYMNSLLQVFFNFLPFRESLLKCPCKEEKKNSLYQIKKVFYSLKYLQVNYYTPSDFPDNFDDEVLNVHLQMDADEFFGNILDKIEKRLKSTKNENLVKYFFQGSQNDILTFQEGCTHHRINVNHFYSIQLQVQNKKNVYESLDALTEGELMNGDNCIFCPQCDKKIPAVKSQKFKTLPRMLIFVLKRFEFDYDTLKKVKINDYYEFPQILDMSKYIMEDKSNGISDKNEFLLKSVIVHMGNTEQGHYYAFIRKEGDKWYQFNDTEVTPFDVSLLEEETFGGDEEFFTNGNKKISQKNRSAYILFYEKKDQSDCQEYDNIEAINLFLKEHNIVNKEENKEENKAENIENEIKEENKEENKAENIINEIKEENKKDEISSKSEDENISKTDNTNANNENDMKDILENLNNEMFKYFLNKKLFSSEYQYFILELFCNILNYYYSYDLPIFLLHLCRNNASNNENLREIQAIGSNLNHYISNKKILLFSKKITNKGKEKTNSRIILNIFKYYIIFFFNVLIRSKDKEYLGCMVDLMKFLINDQLACSDYLIEEFCNKNIIIEYLINCPSYEIKKLIVGILYCAMIKSVNGYEYTKIGQNNKNNRQNKKLSKNQVQNLKEDEELARRISNMEANGGSSTIYENPLENEGIPQNILKMIYNILHIIRTMGYQHLNEQRFLYYIIYRFSLIKPITKEFLIYKCRVFEFLCLLLERSFSTKSYNQKDIINSMDIGLYTVSHNILSKTKKEDESILMDRGGAYRSENYIFMLFFHLLNTEMDNKKKGFTEDPGYCLDNPDFIKVLINNIRTKQDTFCFSNYLNDKCLNNKSKVNAIMKALIEYLNSNIDNNETINYDYNNYQNLVDNDLNANPSPNDPGINPKFLLIIIKRFITNPNLKQEYATKFIKYIFDVFDNNKNFYNFSIMLIDFLAEIFSVYLRKLIPHFQKEISFLINWLRTFPIPPKIYKIEDLYLYKHLKKTYADDLDEKTIKEFDNNQLVLASKKIEFLESIYNGNPKVNNKYEKDLDLTDFRFIIGDIIYYEDEEATVLEALDEMIKIKINNNKQNKIDKKSNSKREIWVETDSDKIRIKELNNTSIKLEIC